MSDILISSRQNTVVKYIRTLREKKVREREGFYALEGIKTIMEAVDHGFYPKRILISPRAEKNSLAKQILQQAASRAEVIRVTDEIIDYAGETEAPQGIIAVMPMPAVDLDDLKIHDRSVFVIIDGVQDPGNVGTMIRTADAFGADAVLLTGGCADVYNPKTLRSTMGSVFHLPVIREIPVTKLLQNLKEKGVNIAATSLGDHCVNLGAQDLTTPLAIAFGSESRGVSPDLIDAADVLLKIPMGGQAESLNVAVAAGIVLYETMGRYGSGPNQTCK